MSAAVYTVELDGEIIARRESLLWVRLDAPGLYVVCTEAEGEGVIVDGEIYHVRGCPILPGKQTVKLDYYELERRLRMDYVGAIIGVLGTILGGVLSYAAFHRNSKKDSEEEGKSSGTMLTEIGYIKGGIDRIERKQDAQDARYIGMAERMSAVESSAKSAHHRIDRLEGREVREDG